MSKQYTKEFKDAVIKQMMPPYSTSVTQLCRETGVSNVTPYKWRKAALSGYQSSSQLKKAQAQNSREDKQKIQKLERELKRKEKALAETAALLVLSKKWEAIWEENEED